MSNKPIATSRYFIAINLVRIVVWTRQVSCSRASQDAASQTSVSDEKIVTGGAALCLAWPLLSCRVPRVSNTRSYSVEIMDWSESVVLIGGCSKLRASGYMR